MTDNNTVLTKFCKRIAGREKEIIRIREKEKPRVWSLETINGVQVLVPEDSK